MGHTATMMNLLLTFVVSVVCSATPVPAAYSHIPAAANATCVDFHAYQQTLAADEVLQADELRRARNKLAAKKCRAKRKERERIEGTQRDALVAENAMLRTENETLKALVAQLQGRPALEEGEVANDMELLSFMGLVGPKQEENALPSQQKRARRTEFSPAGIMGCGAAAIATLATTTMLTEKQNEHRTANSDSDYSSSGDSTQPSDQISDSGTPNSNMDLSPALPPLNNGASNLAEFNVDLADLADVDLVDVDLDVDLDEFQLG